MIILCLPTIIPWFNLERERRLFNAFLTYYGGRARRFQKQVDDIGQRQA